MCLSEHNPDIGVVVPAYNRVQQLQRALVSIEGQTLIPRQVVVVDDGSEQPLQDQLPNSGALPLRFIRLAKNSGSAAARQAGLEALDTTYVAFLDSDDTWLPDKLAHQVRYLSRDSETDKVAVACGWTWVDRYGTKIVSRMPRGSSDLTDFCAGCWFCPGSTILARRQLLLDIGGYDVRMRRLEDLDLFLRFALAGGRLVVAPIDGVRIQKGANARRIHVDSAAHLIQQTYLLPPQTSLTPSQRRTLASWLALEMASVAHQEGHYMRMAVQLARSFSLVPRLQLQLRNWGV